VSDLYPLSTSYALDKTSSPAVERWPPRRLWIIVSLATPVVCVGAYRCCGEYGKCGEHGVSAVSAGSVGSVIGGRECHRWTW
jgi:hypothetical protein